ncbi:MAG: Na+/H+ antiporter NhaC family protein [Xanthomonadales bacterium]|jgi:Na+/H+ antiporter NhaC|nr:Na+/H+ antiporter NhaC family protein [Xanthomonadales bacterium]
METAGTWVSILPPLVAILMALVLRQVVPALFAGIWLGAWAIHGFSLQGAWIGLLESFEKYTLESLANPDHAAIILFTFMIGGTVGVISRNGGMNGIVNHVVGWANSARRACLTTAALGLAVFFDDYANTLVVGNAMRPVTDSMGVSRAKLAYIVDSTAAPVACIALVTTWIGYEVGLLSQALTLSDGLNMDAYLALIASIPYSFYPILAIIFVFMVAGSGRDFGPMRRSEQDALSLGVRPGGHLDSAMAADCEPIDPVPNKPQRAINAVLPIAVLVLAVIAGLYITGRAKVEIADPGLKDIIGAANSYKALLWASLLSMVTATVLSIAQRIMTLEEVVSAWYKGMRAMIYAMITLILAWALASITAELETADFLVSILGDSVPAQLLPFLVFVIAAFTAFATGSSWGAMGILVPLVVPLTWAVMVNTGHSGPSDMHLLYSSIAGVLAGCVWGDHCSPISDTTILSSMASGCDHIEHVRTQMPYAMVVGAVSLGAGTLPVAFGLPWWGGLALGVGLLYLVLRLAGHKANPDQV